MLFLVASAGRLHDDFLSIYDQSREPQPRALAVFPLTGRG